MRLGALPLAILLFFVCGLAAGTTPAAAAGNVTLYQAPDGVDDPGAIEPAVENGTLEPAEPDGGLVVGDRLAVVVDSERLADDLDAHEGTATERFFAALEGDPDLRVVQTNPRPQLATKVAPLGPANVSVHRDRTATYLLVETGNLTFERTRSGENEPDPLRDGERYAVTFGYDLSAFPTDGPEVELYTTVAEFVTAATYYDPLPPERVNRPVGVNLEPEDRLIARLVLEDGREVVAPVEPVEWSGNRGVSLDLRDVDPGTGYALELVHDGEVVDRYEGTVLEPTATVSNATATEIEGRTALNATANLSHGGELRVLNAEGERLGGATLPPGDETDVSVRLHGSAEELVVRAAREDGAPAEFYAGAETTVDVDDRLPDPNRSPTETGTSTGTDGEAVDDQAGGGAVVAALALVAAALLAGWRR